jgi:pimeloyl-ACP methyl ester carboxylesterase
MSYCTRDGVRLYYEDHGRGTPILLTHGFAAATGMWQPQIEAFQHAYRLIPWDMRGHGDSDAPEDQALYSQDHTVADMRGLLDHLGIERAIVAGHSLGGFMSLAFHLAYPDRVQALLLQGCGPGYRNPKTRQAWKAQAERRAQALESKGLDAVGGGAEVGVSKRHSAAGLAKAARGMLTQVDARVIDHIPHISVPTLLIAGDGDTPYLTGIHYMAERIPNAKKVIIAQAGHGANVEQPTVFNEAMQEFLKSLSIK